MWLGVSFLHIPLFLEVISFQHIENKACSIYALDAWSMFKEAKPDSLDLENFGWFLCLWSIVGIPESTGEKKKKKESRRKVDKG